MMDLDTYLKVCNERAKELKDMTPEEKDGIRALLHSDPFMTLVAYIFGELNSRAVQLSIIPLATEEGVRDAIKLQGLVAGMRRFLDFVVDLGNALEPEEENANG